MGASRSESWKCPTCRTSELRSGSGAGDITLVDDSTQALRNRQAQVTGASAASASAADAASPSVNRQLATISAALNELLSLKTSVETLLPLPAKVDQLLALQPAVAELRTTVCELQSTVDSFSTKCDSVLALALTNEESVKDLQKEVGAVRDTMVEQSQEIERLKQELNDSQQYSRLQLDARPPAAETGSALVRVPRFSCSAGMAELLAIMARKMSFPNANNTLHCPNVVLQPVKSKDYKDTNKKKLLWVEIAELMLPGDPTDVSLILVQRRWKSLRDRFTRYVAELAKQQKSGAGAEDTIPDVTLPYFEQMLFLKDTVAHRQTSGNMVVPVVDEGRGTQQDCAEDLLERIADLYEAPDPRGCVDTVLVEDVQYADSPACTSSAANGTSSECVELAPFTSNEPTCSASANNWYMS
ncbi:uncharacterized protein ISCGN_030127 [Ixodes scapularis]